MDTYTLLWHTEPSPGLAYYEGRHHLRANSYEDAKARLLEKLKAKFPGYGFKVSRDYVFLLGRP